MGLLTDFALGAAAGAAKGFTDYGNTLFSVETEKERLRELQRINDANYKRDRQDALDDRAFLIQENDRLYQRERDDFLADRQAGFDRDDDVYDRAREDFLADRTYTEGLPQQFFEDDTGMLKYVDGKGQVTDVTQLTRTNPLLSPAIDAYTAQQRQIDDMGYTPEDNPEAFERLNNYANIIQSAMKDTGEKMGLDVSFLDLGGAGRGSLAQQRAAIEQAIANGPNARGQYDLSDGTTATLAELNLALSRLPN
tara:strand:+ start:840 stop:1595 length:756 start_codon:yes stop_codon:yes gene_type:complete